MKHKLLWIICGAEVLLIIILYICLVLHSQQKQAAGTLSRSVTTEAFSEKASLPETGEETEHLLTETESLTETASQVPETETERDSLSDTDRRVEEILSGMSLEEKAAQLFIVQPEAITGADAVTAAGEATQNAIFRYPVAGFIYMEPNLQEEGQVKDMIRQVQAWSMERTGLPMFISVDEEGGTVTRISGKNFDVPYIGDMADLGSRGDPEEARETGRVMGAYLRDLGFNLDFAPVADVLDNPDNQVVRRRSFGSDPRLVARMSLAFLEGLESQGVYGTLKHFPGHGSTSGDTHAGYASNNKTLEELKNCDLIPFREGILQDVDFIMVGHISLPAVTGDDTPASLSPLVISRILREDLGHEGIVITDAMNMGAIAQNYSASQAAVMALEAGVDLILMPSDFHSAYEGVLEAVRQGRLTEQRIDESLRRILKVKLSLSDDGNSDR